MSFLLIRDHMSFKLNFAGALFLIIFTFFFLASCSVGSYLLRNDSKLSPISFGLLNAKDGVERYQILLKTHQEAISAGVSVDYSGIDTIKIEIPSNPTRIPLAQYNDFNNCVFVIKNKSKDTWLFSIKSEETPIVIEKSLIDNGDFRTIAPLKSGKFLLFIEDTNLWVLKRAGYSYGHPRKDILLIEEGMARNSVTMPYNNGYSNAKCSYVRLSGKPLVVKNLTIKRDPECTYLTHIADIYGFDDVNISNVNIYTPPSTLFEDRGIRIYNCTNIKLKDVIIDGTYSLLDNSGYGINLDNVWNFNAVRLYGRGNWGVFGNNNVNTAHIKNSRINRFDVHCYGKDMFFDNVNFFDCYNQFASVYGTIQYNNCTFTNFVPVLNGSSYNAYVAHDVILNDCIFNITPKKNRVCELGKWNDVKNERYELSEKCWPNLKIKNLTVNMKDGAEDFYLYTSMRVKGNEGAPINYLSRIEIDGLKIVADSNRSIKNVCIFDQQIKTANPIEYKLKNIEARQNNSRIERNTRNSILFQLRPNVALKENMGIIKDFYGNR